MAAMAGPSITIVRWRDGSVDPRTYCEQACSELLADLVHVSTDRARIQQGVVLASFAGRQLSAHDFVRELEDLAGEAMRAQRPAVAAAARAILCDWEARAAHHVGRVSHSGRRRHSQPAASR